MAVYQMSIIPKHSPVFHYDDNKLHGDFGFSCCTPFIFSQNRCFSRPLGWGKNTLGARLKTSYALVVDPGTPHRRSATFEIGSMHASRKFRLGRKVVGAWCVVLTQTQVIPCHSMESSRR
jgi:hypothetical protein